MGTSGPAKYYSRIGCWEENRKYKRIISTFYQPHQNRPHNRLLVWLGCLAGKAPRSCPNAIYGIFQETG